MKKITLPKKQLVSFDGHLLTDHSRSELEVSYERIEKKKRMWDGTLRKFVIADKRSFSFSYNNLPKTLDWTVDGKWGGAEIEKFWQEKPGPFELKLNHGDGSTDTVQVMFASFNKSIVKRGRYDMWNINVELEEI